MEGLRDVEQGRTVDGETFMKELGAKYGPVSYTHLYTKARISRLETERISSELERNRVVVVAGFQGPVSYTHLPHQGLHAGVRAVPQGVPCAAGADGSLTPKKQQPRTCLLYTSRCV